MTARPATRDWGNIIPMHNTSLLSRRIAANIAEQDVTRQLRRHHTRRSIARGVGSFMGWLALAFIFVVFWVVTP